MKLIRPSFIIETKKNMLDAKTKINDFWEQGLILGAAISEIDDIIENHFGGTGIVKRLETYGRTCYKSEEKITNDSFNRFLRKIIDSGHHSVLEHESISVRIICDRGVSHEIVRHRLASYSQESTRYCDYSNGHITFIIPPWVNIPEGIYTCELDILNGIKKNNPSLNEDFVWFQPKSALEAEFTWCASMGDIEFVYQTLRKNHNWSPQEARSVLPNSLKTEIVMSCNLREWRHFFTLRTSIKAHPQMREIAIPMLKEFQKFIPIIFDDIII